MLADAAGPETKRARVTGVQITLAQRGRKKKENIEVRHIQYELHALGVRVPSHRHLQSINLLIELFVYFRRVPTTPKVHLEKNQRVLGLKKEVMAFIFTSVYES